MEPNENNKEENKTETAAEATTAEATVEPKKEEIDFKAKYYYVAAEMENYRKRMEREKENLLKYGNERVMSDLIQVIDNFDRMIDMLRPDEDQKIKNMVTGLDMVRKQFIETLSKHGLTPVESVGKDFDPNFHEALAQEYAEGKKPNEVIKEFQKGYSLNGRLVRPAKVVVSSDKQ
ncbi:nucleotide exchange factor GrpE [Peredibacter starrii]|uniref:Protein GrpE n=1 Tax=Peredibacter starrii TaxID=28202 RepID=A0AAX4HPR9_9BACT|nr:nucleotide exchange factor GrpE [Peredibacter starrii]WPU65210.1 nucleotide exchange factor GrpE [Peredibacter starrii]